MKRTFSKALFISDLHLTEARPECTRAFYDFMSWIPSDVDALFILGDFFEYWLGDDVTNDLAREVAAALKQCSHKKQITLFFLAGNRDFALGPRYAHTANMTLIEESSQFTIAGHNVVVSHGDLYCTEDISYQRFRRFIRNPFILGALRNIPVRFREKIAHNLRQRSKEKFQHNPVYIDVNASAIDSAMASMTPDLLIHGHTHLANIHEHESFQRVVLGDWHHWGWYACVDQSGPTLTRFSIKKPYFVANESVSGASE